MIALVSEFCLALEEISADEVIVRIFIDGKQFGNSCVDLEELWSSAWISGGHDILTCGCGVPECAGFWDPIFVFHDDSYITWEFDRRYYPIPEKEVSDQVIVGKVVFNRKEYGIELQGLFASLENDPRRGRLGPHGFNFDFLSSPSPQIGELHTPFPAGSSITVAYSAFRQPIIMVESLSHLSMKKLIPTMAAYLAFIQWRTMWHESYEDNNPEWTDGVAYCLKPGLSLADCNESARATAESLKKYWKDNATVRWQRIEDISGWETVTETID